MIKYKVGRISRRKGKQMNNKIRIPRNILLTLAALAAAFGVSIVMQKVLAVDEHITTIFVFAVFIISMFTDGYAYGIVSTALAVIAINYAFTFPYFAFAIKAEDIISAIVMIVISLLTSMLTTRIKKWEKLKAEGEREKMRANLLRAVSHDLRTPLTTIYGSSSAMVDGFYGFSDEQKLKMIGGIKSDSEWLIRMVENLLSVTKLEDGALKLIKTPTVLEELIDSVAVKFKKRYPEAPLEIRIPDEMVMIPMDAILIEQVLLNILDNAVVHAENMTSLTLEVLFRGERAEFRIYDDGKGIDKERLAHLFSGYLSAKSADSTRRNLGIGLSVCATIIKAHGSQIMAENRQSGGALFFFELQTDEDSGLEP